MRRYSFSDDLDLFTLDADAHKRGYFALRAVAEELGASLETLMEIAGIRLDPPHEMLWAGVSLRALRSSSCRLGQKGSFGVGDVEGRT